MDFCECKYLYLLFGAHTIEDHAGDVWQFGLYFVQVTGILFTSVGIPV